MQASVSLRPAERLAQDLTGDLTALMKHVLMSSSAEFFATVEKLGLTFTQVKTLSLLRDAESPLTVKALSDQLGLSLPAVSRAVESLVRRGEVHRNEDELDRRCKRVALTGRGRRTFDQLAARRAAGVRRFVNGLDPDDRDALSEALAPIVERYVK
jgi:DNA-binding MarR family transcriptional regulator